MHFYVYITTCVGIITAVTAGEKNRTINCNISVTSNSIINRIF